MRKFLGNIPKIVKDRFDSTVQKACSWQGCEVGHKIKDKKGVVINDHGGSYVKVRWSDGLEEDGVLKDNLKKLTWNFYKVKQ